MQTNSSRPVAINLKKLITAEIIILGFCLWLAAALHAHAEIPLWYQGSVKTVIALLLIATCPLVPVPALRWPAIKPLLLTGVTSLFVALTILGIVYSNIQIDSARDRFAVALLATASGLAIARLFKQRRSAKQG